MRLLQRLSLIAVVAAAVAAPSAAQSPTFTDPEARGTSYYVFAEPGAPTVEVVMLGGGVRTGIYRLQRGATLVQALALAGGTAQSDSSRVGTTTAIIRVVRETAGSYTTVFQTTSQDLLQSRSQHPALQSGDTIEVIVDFEPAEEPGFTFLDGLNVASRIASVVSLVFILIRRF